MALRPTRPREHARNCHENDTRGWLRCRAWCVRARRTAPPNAVAFAEPVPAAVGLSNARAARKSAWSTNSTRVYPVCVSKWHTSQNVTRTTHQEQLGVDQTTCFAKAVQVSMQSHTEWPPSRLSSVGTHIYSVHLSLSLSLLSLSISLYLFRSLVGGPLAPHRHTRLVRRDKTIDGEKSEV